MKRTHWMCMLLGGLCLSSAVSTTAQAESLWARRSSNHAYLFQDTRARRVGDLLTIVVAEDVSVNNSEDRALDKSTEADANLDFESATGGGFGAQGATGMMDFGSSSSRSFGGEATYRSARAFSGRISVTVMDVLPNGNLVISGQRKINVAGDERTLVVSGIVRANDIGPDNTINSRFIADMRMHYVGQGVEQKFTNQGWLGRVVNVVWPF